MLGNQSEILFQEILDVQKILGGWTKFFFFSTEILEEHVYFNTANDSFFRKISIHLFWLDPQGDNRTVRINLLRYVHLILCNNISFFVAQNVSLL